MANSLSTNSKNFACVINLPLEGFTKDEVSHSIEQYVINCSDEYYFIFHDRDFKDEKLGVYKTPHFHLLFHIKNFKRIGTVINELCDNLYRNERFKNCISVRTWVHHDQDVQYLIHKNDSTKARYKIDEIVTNQPELLAQILDYDLDLPFDIPKLKALAYKHLQKGGSFAYINYLEEIGLARANLYMRVINEIWKYVIQYQQQITEELMSKNYQGDFDDLPF